MNLRQTRTKVIGDKEYQVTQLGAVKGSQVFLRLVKVLGPLLGGNLDVALGSLKEDDVTYLINAFQPYTMVPGEGQLDKIFDIHFAGKYKEMIEWLLFSVEVNFGDFLGALAPQNGVGATLAAYGSPSPTAATGVSGGSS